MFLALTILVIVSTCSKDDPTIEDDNWCGTVDSWTQTLTAEDMEGDWVIWKINYRKGTGYTELFDTTYSLTTQLTLNENGTGTIYDTPFS